MTGGPLALVFVYGGGGEAFFVVLLVFLAMFFVVPFLLLRGARSVLTTVPTDGWAPEPGWSGAGWQAPAEPALPPVSAADVTSLRDRLAHDVSTLEPGDDAVARQALADAAERHATCSTLLERASSQAQLRTAWLAAVEGLTAARVVRDRLGLDPGPEIPLPPSGPQLQQPTRLDVGGRTVTGGPQYAPGRAHWFPGGAYGGAWVPGGWYDVPFWPSALVLGGLTGLALGGLASGAVFADDVDGWGGGWDDGGAGWGDSDRAWGGGDGGGGDGWGGSGGFGGFGGGGDFGGGGGFGGGGDGGW